MRVATLRGTDGPESFCYYHHTTRKPVQNPRQRRQRRSQVVLHRPEDRSAVLASIADVLDAIAMNRVDARRGGILLYGLQIAASALPKDQADRTPEKPIEIVVEEPSLGLVAPAEPYSSRYERGMEREHSLQRNIDDLQARFDRAQAKLQKVTAERNAADEAIDALATRMHELEARLAPPNATQEATIPLLQAAAETPKYQTNRYALKTLRKIGGGGGYIPAQPPPLLHESTSTVPARS